MKLCEYDDETLLEEVKHRGFEIKVTCHLAEPKSIEELIANKREHTLSIEGLNLSLPHNEYPKYIRCKIKNIATPNKAHAFTTGYFYLEVLNELPSDCIRLNSAVGWCYNSCEGAVCRECEL